MIPGHPSNVWVACMKTRPRSEALKLENMVNLPEKMVNLPEKMAISVGHIMYVYIYIYIYMYMHITYLVGGDWNHGIL